MGGADNNVRHPTSSGRALLPARSRTAIPSAGEGGTRPVQRDIMNVVRALAVVLVVWQLACTSGPRAVTEPWPTHGWQVDTPESQGVDSERLALAIDLAIRQQLPIHGLLIVRNGVLVFEGYFYPYDPEVPHDVASVTKS